MFHSLGKVLYNKRELVLPANALRDIQLMEPGLGDPGEEKEDQEALAVIRALPKEDLLPPHLAEFQRRKSLLQMDVSFAPPRIAACDTS